MRGSGPQQIPSRRDLPPRDPFSPRVQDVRDAAQGGEGAGLAAATVGRPGEGRRVSSSRQGRGRGAGGGPVWGAACGGLGPGRGTPAGSPKRGISHASSTTSAFPPTRDRSGHHGPTWSVTKSSLWLIAFFPVPALSSTVLNGPQLPIFVQPKWPVMGTYLHCGVFFLWCAMVLGRALLPPVRSPWGCGEATSLLGIECL